MPRLADLCPAFAPRAARTVAASCLVSALWLATPVSAATLYDEDVGGDLTADEGAAPNVGMLAEGDNSISGAMTDFGDAFRVELGPGLEITGTSIEVSSFAVGGSGRARLKTGDFAETFDVFDFDANGSYPFLGPPLPPHTYLFKIFPATADPAPTFDWEVRLTVPEPAGGALAALAALAVCARRRRAL